MKIEAIEVDRPLKLIHLLAWKMRQDQDNLVEYIDKIQDEIDAIERAGGMILESWGSQVRS